MCNGWWINEAIREIVLSPKIGRIGARLMGTDEVRLWHDQVLYKPGSGSREEKSGNVGWHQDYGHWQCASTQNMCTAWIALQDTDLGNGGMRTIVGSHKWGLSEDSYTFGEKDLEGLRKRFEREGQPWIDEPCVLKAGQASFHHSLTFHGSGPNLSDQPRLSIVVHMMPADCAYRNHRQYHPNAALLGPGAREGDLYAGKFFPTIWKKG
jgi:ectoine hydroxylase-related dioxygenase (phytanoyl-CoA dioxygenase family)